MASLVPVAAAPAVACRGPSPQMAVLRTCSPGAAHLQRHAFPCAQRSQAAPADARHRSPVVVCAEGQGQSAQQTIKNETRVTNKSPDLGKSTPKLDQGGPGFPPNKDDGGGGGGGGGDGWGRFAWGFGFWSILLLVSFLKDKDERRR